MEPTTFLGGAHARAPGASVLVSAVELEDVGCAMAVCDDDGVVTGCSPSARDLFGDMGRELGVLPAVLPEELWLLLEAGAPGVAVQWRADERTSLVLGCTRYEMGQGRWLLVMSDISQKQTWLAHRLREQRLEYLGRLVTSTAHDLRAPLSSIVFNTDVLASRIDGLPPERVRETLSDVRTSAERMRNTLDALLDYVRIGPPVTSELSIKETLARAQTFLRPAMRSGGHRVVDLTSQENDRVVANRIAVDQIFLNLLLNAMEAATGAVTVRVSSDHEGDHTRILVEDDGPGIAPEHCLQVFDPFFTTKPEGTGIGLSAAREAARAVGGDLQLARSTGGASFVLTLPSGARP